MKYNRIFPIGFVISSTTYAISYTRDRIEDTIRTQYKGAT